MASWVALNVEPDDGIEEEVDDTKELQIEEALKLYHSALKLHAQGPEYYPQAAEAYDSLLNSEIFRYPESLSDFKRPDLTDAQPAAVAVNDAAGADAVVEFNVNDSTSSLFQTLYLSYKNHGKYLLDSLHETLRNTPQGAETTPETARRISKATKDAVQSFAEALERDDTDLNLWRQSARLGSALQSYRLNRFCLESVLADDDNRLEVRSTQLGLEETFSEERLRSTLESLFDGLSASQIPVKKPKKALEKYLKQHADLYPYLPTLPTDIQSLNPGKGPLALSTSRREIRPSEVTWEAVGKALLEALSDEEDASIADGPSKAICIALPPKSSEALDIHEIEEMDQISEDGGTGKTGKLEDEDVDMLRVDTEAAETEKPTGDDVQDHPNEDQSSIDQSAENQLMESLERQSVHPPETQAPDENANPEEAVPTSPSETRKRSSASAANDEQTEGGRMKSRRTRARESNADALAQPDEVAFDHERYYEDCLEVYVNADEWMFNTLGSMYSKVGIEALGTIGNLKEKVATLNDSEEAAQEPETRLIQDLRGISKTWNDEKSRLMLQKDDLSPLKDIRGSNKSGLSVFLEHSRSGTRKPVARQELGSGDELYRFSETINGSWLHPNQTLYEWLRCLLMPEFGNEPSQWPVMKSTYTSLLWSNALKETAVELLLREDDFIFSRMSELVTETEQRVLESSLDAPFEYRKSEFAELEMIQSIYELHLDVFSSFENPGIEESRGKQHAQNDRLARWGILARSALDILLNYCPSEDCRQNLALRHLWASTFHVNLAGEAEREHILLCLQDLKHILLAIGDPCLTLLNNPTMSDLSVATVDQELLKLKCMDFFAKVFNPEDEDPVSLIEAIEPILEPSFIECANGSPEQNDMHDPSSTSSEMGAFLDRGDATLRLFLWRRLQEAYQAIDYPPKVVSCYLRSIEIIMKELEDAKHLEETSGHRQLTLLGWLKSLDGIMAKAIPLILQQAEKAYECVDMEHLQASTSAVARLARVLHTFVLYEDSIRVGQISGRELRGSLAKSFENFKERMRELYVRCWILQYTLFVEAISQNKDVFEEPLEDRIRLLRSVHNALGVRSMCRYSQKRFLKLMKSELLDLKTKGDYEFDICQVLLDLHGIRFSPFDGTSDHGCSPEKLDRPTAIMMIDFVMRQAQNMNMKDLSKSDLKTTIEKMQQAIVPAKISSSPQMTFNRRIFNGYIKAAINPSGLLRAVQGVLELSLLTVPGENAQIAAKGWYFLLGHAALTKFRSQKRLSPGSTTELDDAINFFRLDIDHGSGRWETWYRLAQAYDTKLDEEITWTADKINNSRSDLAATQRYAIHCYAMAVSTAMRTAEPTSETRALLSDLYTDFGIRVYSSSRGPLSMGAFSLSDFSRHFSSEESQQMYKGQPFKEMSSYSVWNFAYNLLKRALVDKPKRWITHYFIGKCLWKMYSCDDSMRTTSKRVEMHDVLDAFHDAISSLPKRKDSRADPIFEPHFKLVSIVHKLVLRGDLTLAEASQALQATPWARKVEAPGNSDGWKPYILEVIRKFKSADKSNWHHRMSVKAAHVIYDDEKNATAAAAAKQELSQIFTKTLTIQVWRPEFERPGRHFVYTTRYVYFFVSLLDQLDDRPSLDQLLRRVRKKQGDFINHTKLWEDVCLTYAKMIRRAAHINEGHEESVFKPIGWEEFSTKTARLETLTQLSPDSLPLLELIRDSLELKKLNNNLMKVTMFEDLVADLYARVYELNMPLLIEQANEENKEKMKVDHLLMTGDTNTETSTPATSLPASDTPAPRGRTKGIARRDVQKRADTIVNLKLGPRTAASKFTATADTDQSSLQGPNCTSAPTSAPSEAGKQTSGAGASAGVPRSDNNSLNDTADESDLSDIDESKLDKLTPERKSHFSKVHHAEAGDVETETDNDGADEGDGEGEGEGEDEEGDENDDGEDEDDPAATGAEAGGDEEQDEEGEDEENQDEDEAGPNGDETKLDDDVEATDKEADRDDDEPSELAENQPDDKDLDDSMQGEIVETPEPTDVTPT